MIYIRLIVIVVMLIELRLHVVKVLHWLDVIVRLISHVLIWCVDLVLIWIESLDLLSKLRILVLLILINITVLKRIFLFLSPNLIRTLVHLIRINFAVLNFIFLLILYLSILNLYFFLNNLKFILNKSML